MKRFLFGFIACSLLMREVGSETESAGGGTPAPSLSDQLTENFKGLTEGDAAANVIEASAKTIEELNGITFGGLSQLGQQIMTTQVAEAVKTVEVVTKNVLDEIEAA